MRVNKSSTIINTTATDDPAALEFQSTTMQINNLIFSKYFHFSITVVEGLS